MNKTTRIAIIGNGNVGSALAKGLGRAGYDVRAVGNVAVAIKDAANDANVVILAVPYSAIDDALHALGEAIDGKIVVDVTNALTAEMQLAVGFSTSGAEQLQKKAPKAKVVKAFNTQFAAHMSTGRIGDSRLTTFAASDDSDAKQLVLQLAQDIGFDAVDAGMLSSSRHLEALGVLNIHVGYVVGLGGNIGLKLVRG